ncbi:hypothetical protein N0V82_009687 [Gnomoniopsis sp. IMI 355080]|nr:hypothetical protein N0V82_009687 [Gnomoniopsis sp. IMI 355080]
MQSTINEAPAASPANKVPVASLLISPPEQTPYESFDQGQQATIHTVSTLPSMKKPHGNLAQQPPSPPISPLKKPSNQVQTTTAGSNVKDPILYPEELTSPVQPLFSHRRPSSVEAIDITRHMNARRKNPLKRGVKTPDRRDYEYFAYVVTAWNGAYERLRTDAERAAYQQAELAQVRSDDRARLAAHAESNHAENNHKSTKKYRATSHKLLKAKPDRASITVKDVVASATGPHNSPKVTKSGRQTAKPRVKASPAAEEKKSKVSKTQTVDIDYNHIPDYCPPMETLNSMKMSIPSVSNPRPFEENELQLLPLLHPQEQDLARNLRISPATYLTTKRRIFVDRLHFYHYEKQRRDEEEAEGKTFVKDFKKTHAQNAGKIDVNKSSKLHEAFDSVGWFDRKWCERHAAPTFDNAKDKHFFPGDGNGKPGPIGYFTRKT